MCGVLLGISIVLVILGILGIIAIAVYLGGKTLFRSWPEGSRGPYPPSKFGFNDHKCVFNKHPIMVCIRCSWQCLWTFAPSTQYSFNLYSSWSNLRIKVEGPWTALFQLGKHFESLRMRLGSFWKYFFSRRKSNVFFLSDLPYIWLLATSTVLT